MVEIKRITRLKGDSQVKAFVDVNISGITIKGLKIVEGKNGLFVGWPQREGKDGKWYPIVIVEDESTRNSIQKAILDEYQGGRQPGQDEDGL